MKSTFKILLGIACFALIGLTSSCSKDSGLGSVEKKILGKWQSTSMLYQEYENGKLVSEDTETCIDWYMGFNFMSEGKGQVILYEEGESMTGQMSWVVMGDKLMITASGFDLSESLTLTIVEVKGDSMILEMVDEYTLYGTTYKDIERCTFKKLK